MTVLNIREQVSRGAKAEKLLGDPMLVEAFDCVRLAILSRIEAAPLEQEQAVHEFRLMLKLLKDVRANLEAAVRDGKVIAFRLREAEEAEQRRELSPAEWRNTRR